MACQRSSSACVPNCSASASPFLFRAPVQLIVHGVVANRQLETSYNPCSQWSSYVPPATWYSTGTFPVPVGPSGV